MKPLPLNIRKPLVREVLIFLVFLALTVLMTWPWMLHLRDAVPDTGDPYAISYFLWWDYHQTFHDPLNLFQATIFYPYHYTLAFGEYDYGVSLLFFPLFFLGFRPLTIYSVAAFLSFPFTGYATFRLGRTISGNTAIAWIAGIIIAFLPFRFHHLAHLHLIFAGWLPLLFEALVLYARERSWRRATWLAVAFFMNALTCTTWFILSIIPLIVSATVLLWRYKAWGDRRLWLRGAATLFIASLLLLPFLLPLRRVATEYGFVRKPEEVRQYSARFVNWLAPDERTRAWHGFGTAGIATEMVLFPGLMAPLLAIAALLLTTPKPHAAARDVENRRDRWLLILLDSIAVLAGVIAFLSLGFAVLRLKILGHLVLSASGPGRALSILAVTLLVRCLFAYPLFVSNALGGDRNLRETLGSTQRSETAAHALLWIAIGFAGSFGLNFVFHKFLYQNVALFRGMRVATRWAMICYIGLALLAGLGAKRLADRFATAWPRFGRELVYALVVVAILIDLHATPLTMLKGAADPDAITRDLRSRSMHGGILELPIGDRDHLYMLRAADHGHPIVNGRYSFVPPIPKKIEELIATEPDSDQLFTMIESIPVSYVTVHRSLLAAEDTPRINALLQHGIATGKLRLVKTFPSSSSEVPVAADELYVVTKTEPAVSAQ